MAQFGFDTKGTEVVAAFPDKVKNRIFLITGPSKGGLGAATAVSLAEGHPKALILVGRSRANAQPVIEEINQKAPNVKTLFIEAEFGNLASVRKAAEEICRLDVPIDGIVANAAVMAVPWEKTVDGIECHFQTNHLSHFLLVNLLLERVPRQQGSRIVVVSSSVRPDAPVPKFDDWNFSDGKTYHPLEAYSQSKFANVLFSKSLAKALSDKHITSFSVNPGNITTNLQTYLSPELISSWLQRKKDAGEDLPLLAQQKPKSLLQGCSTALRALLDPSLEEKSGAFLDNCQVLSLPNIDFPAGEPGAKQLWELSERLVGQEFKLS
ncbi:hypothetical protein VTN00DRAFT_2769 [Thermoascus crustaceus]|uniref:uncharacterized protein n=1 Tax=Thermoascus crustaceus TaxID=5088 RepID=UPI0037435F39